MQHNADIVIVGAGLVGSALSCALAQADSGLNIVVIEAKPELPNYSGDRFDPRVVALSPASIRWLDELNIWPKVLASRACPYYAMEVWDGEGNGSVGFHCDQVHRDYLGYIVENSVVVGALRQRMQQLTNVQLWAPCQLESVRWPSADGQPVVLSTEDDRCIHAPLIVGADGAQSILRQWAQLPTRAWRYGQSAIITTVQTEFGHQHTAWQRFTHQGPLAFLPLISQSPEGQAGHFSSIVWSLDEAQAQDRMALPEPEFLLALESALERRLGKVLAADARYCVPLQQMHARNYIRPGLALVGDAAHTLHPLAGQGVNLGLYDARALQREVIRARERGFCHGHQSVLNRYQRQRKTHNLAAMMAMEGFKRAFGTSNPIVLALRNRGLAGVQKLDGLKRWFVDVAVGEQGL